MHDPFQDFCEVYFALCKSVNTPFSLGCWLRWREKQFFDAPAPRPSYYDDAESFGKDYLVWSWPSKAKIDLGIVNLEQVALESFIADEVFNEQTTKRIKDAGVRGFSPRVESAIHGARRKISSILGVFNLRKFVDDCRFGNGASATLSRKRARYDQKLSTFPLSVSPAALGLAKACIEADPAWVQALIPDVEPGCPVSLTKGAFEVIDYNVFDTVPKSLKTDRTIAKEPTLNGFLQQGVHNYLRTRLKRHGVNLRDQGVNQCLASVAQEIGLSTLDLKSASNSVTCAVVEMLLPPDWYNFLDILRSRWTRMPDGSRHRNVMFSSMGNAFTFELESMIFYALAHAVCGGSDLVAVYGDDIIVPQSNSGEMIEVLEALGFRINVTKSFVTGRFFESCGKHFFDGCDVTPAYQKEAPRSSVYATLRAHNRLVRWASRRGLEIVLDRTVFSAAQLLARGVDRRLYGPIGLEDDLHLQVPYGNYRVLAGYARCHQLELKKIERRTRQKASYAYWLRLRAQADDDENRQTGVASMLYRSSRSWVLSARVYALYDHIYSPEPALTLSEWTTTLEVEDDQLGLKKRSIPLDRVRVGLSW